jgi:hypothetical protein
MRSVGAAAREEITRGGGRTIFVASGCTASTRKMRSNIALKLELETTVTSPAKMMTSARTIREGEQVVTLLEPKDKIAEKVKDQDRFVVHFQQLFKGTVSRDFSSPVFFSSNNFSWSQWACPETISNFSEYSWSYSYL